jgi:zinc transporter ZupT
VLVYATILFITALAGGLAAFKLPLKQNQTYRLLLVFAGAYLFAITVTHLLPEILQGAQEPHFVGLLVLAGFFLQLMLEYLTAGVEHGHVHPPANSHNHHHYHSTLTPLSLLIALCLHAFMEGTLLLHPAGGGGAAHQTDSLLVGIVLHKAPAAFALVSVLIAHMQGKKWPMVMLIVFALASPLGLWFSELMQGGTGSLNALDRWVYPLVAGSFLHISTTIFFENSPDHRFNFRKLVVSFIGAGLGAMVELFG